MVSLSHASSTESVHVRSTALSSNMSERPYCPLPLHTPLHSYPCGRTVQGQAQVDEVAAHPGWGLQLTLTLTTWLPSCATGAPHHQQVSRKLHRSHPPQHIQPLLGIQAHTEEHAWASQPNTTHLSHLMLACPLPPRRSPTLTSAQLSRHPLQRSCRCHGWQSANPHPWPQAD